MATKFSCLCKYNGDSDTCKKKQIPFSQDSHSGDDRICLTLLTKISISIYNDVSQAIHFWVPDPLNTKFSTNTNRNFFPSTSLDGLETLYKRSIGVKNLTSESFNLDRQTT